MTLGDASNGDVVRIGSVDYWLTIAQRGGFLCRYRDEPGDAWSREHVWLLGIEPIDEIVKKSPVRDKRRQAANVDPLDNKDDANDSFNWKGTRK